MKTTTTTTKGKWSLIDVKFTDHSCTGHRLIQKLETKKIVTQTLSGLHDTIPGE